jgi:hypothetical protein
MNRECSKPSLDGRNTCSQFLEPVLRLPDALPVQLQRLLSDWRGAVRGVQQRSLMNVPGSFETPNQDFLAWIDRQCLVLQTEAMRVCAWI